MKKKDQSEDLIGVQILRLFALDLLGADSREAKVFENQLRIIENKLVLSWLVKSFVISIMLLLNIFFIFACMLYGRAKGLSWQCHWLLGSVANLIVDIVFKHCSIAVVVHFLIPDVIHDQTAAMKRTLQDTVHKLCIRAATSRRPRAGRDLQNPQEGDHSNAISPSQAFFVSTHVAKAFPNTLESSLVLAHRWASPPPACRPRTHTHTRENKIGKHSTQDQLQRRREAGVVSGLRYGMAQVLTWFLLVLGSQLPLVQKMATGVLSTLAVYAMAYVATGLMRLASLLQWIFLFGVAAFAAVVLSKKRLSDWFKSLLQPFNASKSSAVAPLSVDAAAAAAAADDDDSDRFIDDDADGDISKPAVRVPTKEHKASGWGVKAATLEVFELVFEGSSERVSKSESDNGFDQVAWFASGSEQINRDSIEDTDKRNAASLLTETKKRGNSMGDDGVGSREDEDVSQDCGGSLGSNEFDFSISSHPSSEGGTVISAQVAGLSKKASITGVAGVVGAADGALMGEKDCDQAQKNAGVDGSSACSGELSLSLSLDPSRSEEDEASSLLHGQDAAERTARKELEFNFSSDPSIGMSDEQASIISHLGEWTGRERGSDRGREISFALDDSSPRGAHAATGLHFEFSSESDD